MKKIILAMVAVFALGSVAAMAQDGAKMEGQDAAKTTTTTTKTKKHKHTGKMHSEKKTEKMESTEKKAE